MAGKRRFGPGIELALRALSVTVVLLGLAACGGGSGGGSGSGSGSSSEGAGSDTVTVSGKVTDPEISGAAVYLQDGDGKALTQVVQSGSDGSFRFTLNGSMLDENLRVVAVGGKDTKTGQDLVNLRLVAPYTGSDTDLVVSPLSTLGLACQEEDPCSISDLAGLLRLSGPEQLLEDPALSVSGQKASLLITDLLVALQGVDDPVRMLLDQLQSSAGDFPAAAEALAADPDIPETVAQRLRGAAWRAERLENESEALADAAAVVRAMNRIHVHQGLAAYLEQTLGYVPAGDAQEQRLWDLADAVISSLNGKSVPADSAALLNIARYLVVAHELTAETLASDTFETPQPLDPDSLLPLLADSETVNTALPLAPDELLGSDNEARVTYFFRSDQSPYYRAARLFDGVIDDQVLDPVYVEVATGLAEAGLTEQARLTVESSVFQKPWKAHAYLGIGSAQAGLGDNEGALESWQKALELYNAYMGVTEDASGVPAISADDGLFYQKLSSEMRAAGYVQEADQALATLERYFEAQEDQPYSTAYGRLAVAAGRNAGDLVEEAVAQGLSGTAFSNAHNSVTFFHRVVSGMGQQSSSNKCYALKTLQLADVGEMYLQLGQETEAGTVLDEYEALAEVSCNHLSVAVYADDYAGIYGALERTDEFRNFLTARVRTYDEEHGSDYEARALQALAVYEAREKARSGEVDAAIETILAFTDDLQEQIERLTFIGDGSGQGGTPYLARLLWEDELPEAALAVADAAFDIAASDAYKQSEISPGAYLGQGCRKVAVLYDWLGRPDLARQRMDSCSSLGEARMEQWSTEEQADAWAYLAGGYYLIGAHDASQSYIDQWEQVIDLLSDPMSRAYQYASAALYRAGNGAYEQALELMADSVEAGLSAAGPETEQASLENAISRILGGTASTGRVDQYRDFITYLRNATLDGEPDAPARAAREARDLLRRLLVGEDGASGVLPLVNAVNDPEARENYYQELVYWLTYAGFAAEAEALAITADLDTSRNARLAQVAGALVEADAWPDNAVLRFDFDDDGLPDFYSPASSDSQRQETGLALDPDIDGDGLPATTDRTPYCTTCEL